jgi:hypothetical protein
VPEIVLEFCSATHTAVDADVDPKTAHAKPAHTALGIVLDSIVCVTRRQIHLLCAVQPSWSTTDLLGRLGSTRTPISEPNGKRLERLIVSGSDSAFEVFFEISHLCSSPTNIWSAKVYVYDTLSQPAFVENLRKSWA